MTSTVSPDTTTDMDRSPDDEIEMITVEGNNVIVEELEEVEDEIVKKLKKVIEPVSPPKKVETPPEQQGTTSPLRASVTREFGNISPISELLDDDDLDLEGNGDAVPGTEDGSESVESGTGKITPEPGPYPNARNSFPRISDGRSSPILAYSPSLLKSPPSNGSSKVRNSNSPSSNGDRIQKRPRNIARILDNISDHSSGEEDKEVNTVGTMMAQFTV